MYTTFGLSVVLWICISIVFYAYSGYGLLLYVVTKFKRKHPVKISSTLRPHKVAFIVCAFNEEKYIIAKISNSITSVYPNDYIVFVFITDGSNDQTAHLAASYSPPNGVNIRVLHQPERRGKIAAFQRAMTVLKNDIPDWSDYIVVTTDANTMINPEAVELLARHFDDPVVGAVAGEKRIRMAEKDAAPSAGEGIYWKYESLLKKWDAQLWSVVGAAGELFAFRVAAYEPVPLDSLTEDFYMTMRIAQKGYRVAYEPGAYAVEASSASVSEELKRKIRISAGGLQSIWRLRALLNIFRYGTLSFQYISHRVLRWFPCPFLLPVIFITNALLLQTGNTFYTLLFWVQVLFYLFAVLGYLLERRQLKVKAFFIPYYFCVMNYSVYAGAWRLWRGRQSVVWEKAKRMDE